MISEAPPGRVIYTDLVDATAVLIINTKAQKVLEYQIRNGFDAYLAFVGDGWDVGANNHITKRVLVDGGGLFNFKDSKIQYAPLESSDREISPWIALPQGSVLRYEADLDSTSPATVNVSAKFKIKYVQKMENNR